MRDVGLLVFLGAMWGTSFMAIKAGLVHFDPIWFAAIRYDLAALVVILGVIAVGKGRSLIPTNGRQWTALAVTGTLNMMVYHAFLFWGQQFTTSAIAAVIVGLNPIASTVFSRALLPAERVGMLGVVGLLAGILGLAVLVGLKPGDLLDARGKGELAVAIAIVAFAAGTVISRRLDHGMPVIPFTGIQMGIGAIELHIVSLIMEGTHPATAWTPTSITALLYLAIPASALGFYLFFTLVGKIGPVRTSLVSYIAPAFAALAGWIVLGEGLELRAVVAYMLIVSGFWLVIRAAPPPRAPKSAQGPAIPGHPSAHASTPGAPATTRRAAVPPPRVRWDR